MPAFVCTGKSRLKIESNMLWFASLYPSPVSRTLYIEGEKKLAFASWCSAIQSAAGSGGDTLSQQQLIDTDIPVIVNSCISYITQFGEKLHIHTQTHTQGLK